MSVCDRVLLQRNLLGGSAVKYGALLLRVVGVLCSLVLMSQAGKAEKRAFVTGINAYDKWAKLRTAVNDANAVAELLHTSGFVVTRAIDPTYEQFDKEWREFLTSLQAGDLIIVYFAGHGFQIDSANYLVLRDTPKADAGENALIPAAINFHELMQQLQERQPAKTIYILDACRTSPLEGRSASAGLGQLRGFAVGQEVDGTFVLYSAGPNQEALDYLKDPNERNSVYARRLLGLLRIKDLGLDAIAVRVRTQVEEDARTVPHEQVPAYINGIRRGQYLWDRLEAADKALSPNARITSSTVVRLGGFATWDDNCQSRPAPRITTTARPRYGRILTRFESFTIGGKHSGSVACEKTAQKGIGVYYAIDDAYRDSTAVDRVQFTVKHWAIAPVVEAPESYSVDLATKHSRRTTGR
jgi:hypothetical protein